MKLRVLACVVLVALGAACKSQKKEEATLSVAKPAAPAPSGSYAGLYPVSCVPPTGGIRGNGNLSWTAREANDFESVSLNGSGEAYIKEGPRYEVLVQVDNNVQGFIKVETKGKTLEIGTTEDSFCWNHLEVYVTMPRFRGAKVQGSGRLEATKESAADAGAASDVTLGVNGSGKITFRGNALALGASVNGSGTILLESGSATTTSATVNGSGSVTKATFNAGTLAKSINGSGAIEL